MLVDTNERIVFLKAYLSLIRKEFSMSVYKKMKPYVPGMGGILILAFLLIIGSSVALIAEYQAI